MNKDLFRHIKCIYFEFGLTCIIAVVPCPPMDCTVPSKPYLPVLKSLYGAFALLLLHSVGHLGDWPALIVGQPGVPSAG